MASAGPVAVAAASLSLLQRCIGVLPLEVAAFGASATAVISMALVQQTPGSPPVGALVLPVLVSLGCGLPLSAFYHRCRRTRSGEVIALIMSFALMRVMTIWAIRASEGKSIVTIASALRGKYGSGAATRLDLAVVLLSTLVLGVLGLLLSPRSQTGTKVRLARSNDALLWTFGTSGERVRATTYLVGAVVWFIGSVMYCARQDTFAVQDYDSFLIPTLAVSILVPGLNIWGTAVAALVVAVLRSALLSGGGFVLVRLFESLGLVALVSLSLLTSRPLESLAAVTFWLKHGVGRRRSVLTVS